MFVTSFYLVRDKLCFSRTRWMSYGLCSLAGGVWNPKPRNLWRISKSWRYSEGDLEDEDKDGGGSIQEISRLMKIFKDRWWKVFMESLEANILSKDMMKMSSKPNINAKKKNILVTSSREWS